MRLYNFLKVVIEVTLTAQSSHQFAHIGGISVTMNTVPSSGRRATTNCYDARPAMASKELPNGIRAIPTRRSSATESAYSARLTGDGGTDGTSGFPDRSASLIRVAIFAAASQWKK